MRKLLVLLVIVMFLNPVFSQTIGEFVDVVYLKNGEIVKGVIVEQIPGKSVSVLIENDRIKNYEISEIAKFSREKKIKWINSFKKKEKGYFIDAEFLLGSIGGELRVTNGYKFGRFGKLGLATGFGLMSTMNNSANPHFLLNIVYSGDILDKRITPYYEVELGYGIVLGDRVSYEFEKFDYFQSPESLDNIIFPIKGEKVLSYGGPKGALAFGLKLKTKKRIEYKFALDYRASMNYMEKSDVMLITDFEIVETNKYKYSGVNLLGGLGFRFGVSF